VERSGFAEVRTFRDRFRIIWPEAEREVEGYEEAQRLADELAS